ncbi:MAG: carbohydrate ABC transporter permease [Treponema sp.]|jgi:raffinose/stachyose/melibiose transport system permease protein|nr:carbohydrate ABC transporter permease [Treponema sp.]
MRKFRVSPGIIILYLFLTLVSLLWVYPFLWMFSASFKTNNDIIAGTLNLIPREFSVENYAKIWGQADFGRYFMNSVTVTVFAVLLVVAMTTLSGYVLGRYQFFGKQAALSVFIASITIPLVSTVIPVFQIIKSLGLLGKLSGLIAAQAGGTHVVFIMLFSSYYKQIPKELEEASVIDGCGFVKTFSRIMLPLAKPIVLTTVIMESIWTWNSFMLPLVLTLNYPKSRTLAVGLYAFRGENIVDWGAIAAGGVLAVFPVIIGFIFCQKYFVNGVAGAVKS